MGSSGDTNDNGSQMGGGEMRSGPMFPHKSSSGSGNPFGSGWDSLENLGGSSPMVTEPYPHGLPHYPPGDFLTKLGSFGSGSFSEMANPFVSLNPECGAHRPSEKNNSSSSLSSREKRRAPHSQFHPVKNGEGEQNGSEKMNEQDEKKQKTGHGNSRGKQMGKQAKDDCDSGGAPKDYIHMRAKRGQATNSHSLAERVRREKISERMKLLQELVPGCNKITGKAVMLDEIINYVQSLQQQVEFLSMKLATVNPEVNVDIDHILSKDILHSQASNSNPVPLGFVPGLSSSQHYPPGTLPNTPTTPPSFHPIQAQGAWDDDLHNLLQMGFDPNSGIHNLGPNGRSKFDL